MPSCEEASKKSNVKRNRYCDVLPYDFNRVRLGRGESSYINASLLQSKETDAAQWSYIAAQVGRPGNAESALLNIAFKAFFCQSIEVDG